MGRLTRLGRKSSPIYAVKENVAALAEELEFTLNYAEALTREKHYHAVAEVIEEQRRSLARASKRMERAVSEPEGGNRARVRVALAGVAAALAIASSAFAAFGPTSQSRPTTGRNTKIEAVDRATAALAKATGISDPVTLQAIVVNAQETILEVAQSGPSDPGLKRSLLDSVLNLQRVIHNPNVPAKVREQAKRVAEQVQKIVVSVPDSSESSPEPTTTATPTPSATPPG